jgi:class 3 adenylate cyclase
MAAATASAAREPAAEAAAVEWRYYQAMAAPFVIDVVISGIFTWILGLPEVFLNNLVIAGVVLLLGAHIGARRLFLPIRRFLRSGEDFAAIERPLTQLPLRSASLVMWLYLPILTLRLVLPLVLDAVVIPGVPLPTWTDGFVTLTIQTLFIFVVVYFLISGYLERLCHFLFERRGVNLGLFFGRFARKIAVALVFTAVAPLVLVAGDLYSYTDERLVREIAIDLIASAFGLGVTLYWVSRSLTRPLARLGDGIARVADDDLGVRLPVTSNEEIGALTARFKQMVEGLRERRQIRETFGKYVSESVAAQLLKQAGDGRLTGETREATLLFTDIEGFTTHSERLAPDLLIAVLNEYLEVVVEPITRHGGVVSSFIGDGLFASFNLPLANPDHAASAIAAALDIQHVTSERRFSGGVQLATRIGINTGTVIGGTIGAGDRLSYTLLGDAVNTAARLQELNKSHGTRILLSEATRRLAGDRFGFRPIGEVPIRGPQRAAGGVHGGGLTAIRRAVYGSARYPQTFAAVSTTRASFAFSSSSPSRLPPATEAKPHCGLSARRSSGAIAAASSSRRRKVSIGSSCGSFELTRPSTAILSVGRKRSGRKSPARALSYSRKKASTGMRLNSFSATGS